MPRHSSLSYLKSNDSDESIVFDFYLRGGDLSLFLQGDPEYQIIQREMEEEARLVSKLLLSELWLAMDKYERPIFQMRFVLGLSVDDIAVVLDRSVQTVYHHLSKIRAKLEGLEVSLLDDDYEGDG